MSTPPILPALAALGSRLGNSLPPTTLVVCGSTAALLNGWLTGRITHDCDVLECDPPDRFAAIRQAAEEIAAKHGLKPTWINQDARIFAWKLPLGFHRRLVDAGTYGPLRVQTLGRVDLIAAKVMGARPQDIEDLLALRPCAEELDACEKNIDRIEAEDLDRTEFPKQRAVVAALRAALSPAEGRP